MDKEELKETEKVLWEGVNNLRGSFDPSLYRDICLGLIFLKHISERFDVHSKLIEKLKAKPEYANFINYPQYWRDNYRQHNVLYVPQEAHWNFINDQRKSPKIKEILDNAFSKIEEENTYLKNIFPKIYSNLQVDNSKLAKLIDIYTNKLPSSGDSDAIGQIYEYFLKEFALTSGQKGGEFYTPRCIVELLVELIQPFKGRIYDPCCGSGGMFIKAVEFVKQYKKNGDVTLWGQEKNPAVWRLCRINMWIRGLEIDVGEKEADTFLDDLHYQESFDYILANPPFNLKKWGLNESKDHYPEKYENYDDPPKNNANYAWLIHIISKLKENGVAAVILANNSVSSAKQEKKIRTKFIEENLIDGIIQLPDKLFYTTGISAVIWLLRKNRQHQDYFFFDASQFRGEMISNNLRELTKEEIKQIAGSYHQYLKKDKEGLSKQKVKENDYLLLPSIYTYQEEKPQDPQELKEEIKKLSSELLETFQKLEVEKKEIEELLIKLKKDGEVD